MSELRAHFPERDAYLDRLAQHYADGLLDDAGFEARRDMLLRATTHGEMLGAFDGLPRPRYAGQDRGGRRGMGRRGLIIGGAVAAGAVVLAGSGAVIMGLNREAPVGEPIAAEAMAWDGEQVLLDLPGMDETIVTLRERGLTLLSEFTVDMAGVRGVAMSPRAPGELRTFEKDTDRPLIVAEGVEAEVPNTVDIDQIHNMLWDLPNTAVIDLGGPGQAQSVSLIFTGRGNPALEVVVGEGDVRTGTVTYDLDDNLIALEEG